jgi:hypothetical protein
MVFLLVPDPRIHNFEFLIRIREGHQVFYGSVWILLDIFCELKKLVAECRRYSNH